MLIVALVLAVIGLASLVTAVVTSNELIAWVCIGASVIGVVLLIIDALRERSRGDGTSSEESDDHSDETTVLPAAGTVEDAEDYPDEPTETVEHPEPNADSETSVLAATDEDESDATKPGSSQTAQ